jgi:FkbM family methyltransferase
LKIKRKIYGLPFMKAYREYRTTQLSMQVADTPYGFRYAGPPPPEEWEPNERRVIAALLGRSSAFIDIGANKGFYACMAATLGKSVAAVEPEPGNLRFLTANVKANSFREVEIFPVALADSPGVLDIYGDGDTASLMRGWAATSSTFRQTVPVNTVDNLFAHRWLDRQITVKMDVEGFEEMVLSGAAGLIGRERKPYWLIETFPQRYDAARSAHGGFLATFRQMIGAGYSAFVANEDMTPVDIAQAERWASPASGEEVVGSNFVFIDSESAAEIAALARAPR